MRIAEQRLTCRSVPVQIEGRLDDGRWFYFRARYESVWLGLDGTPGQLTPSADVYEFRARMTDRVIITIETPTPRFPLARARSSD